MLPGGGARCGRGHGEAGRPRRGWAAPPSCRLRYSGSAHQWGFAIWLASKDGYQDSILPSGLPVGTAEQALDCACGLYLADPTAWAPD